MKGIILAAGRGSRMKMLTDNEPKCFTVLHGKRLIDWQLQALNDANINDVAIVRGYLSDIFKYPTHYFDNIRWADTNMVMSLVAASEWLEKYDCIVSYSDIVYSSASVNLLKNSSADITIAYDPNWLQLWKMRFDDPLSDAETFLLDGSKVVEIGNRSENMKNIQGQYMGLLKITPNGWDEIASHIEMLTDERCDSLDMTTMLQGLIKNGVNVSAISITDNWYEVDTESDLSIYSSLDSLW